MGNEQVLEFAAPTIKKAVEMACGHWIIPAGVSADYLIAYVRRGRLEVCFEDRNVSKILSEGDILFVRPGIRYSVRSRGEQEARIPCLQFDLSSGRDSGGEADTGLRPSQNCRNGDLLEMAGYDIPPIIRMENHGEIYRCISDIIECGGGERDGSVLMQKALVLRMIYLLLQNRQRGGEERTDKYREELKRAAAYIAGHYAERITNETLARISYLSISYFNKLFRTRYGISPTQYMIRCRMDKAKELLGFSALSIWEIAERVGYESVHSFSKAFKKTEHISPGEYRMFAMNDASAMQ